MAVLPNALQRCMPCFAHVLRLRQKIWKTLDDPASSKLVPRDIHCGVNGCVVTLQLCWPGASRGDPCHAHHRAIHVLVHH